MTTRHAGGRMQHFAYDDDNRLLRAWGTGPLGEHDSHYRYDALGRRIHKSVTIKRGAEKNHPSDRFYLAGTAVVAGATYGRQRDLYLRPERKL